MSDRCQPFLMTAAEAVPLKEAARETKLSVPQIRRINRRYRISRQAEPTAKLEVSLPALVMCQHGDLETLEKLRAGERTDPMVRRYFDLCGVA